MSVLRGISVVPRVPCVSDMALRNACDFQEPAAAQAKRALRWNCRLGIEHLASEFCRRLSSLAASSQQLAALGSAAGRGPLGGGEGAHLEGVDLGRHESAEGVVDKALGGYSRQPFEPS
jgi:hypothetical protein